MTLCLRPLFVVLLMLLAVPAAPAQEITVLDNAQDAAAAPACGARPISIARMQWPSAAILAEIHSRLLASELGCTTQILAGDLASTLSGMGSTGQPAAAPEFWATRAVTVWNQSIEAQAIRPAGNAYDVQVFEGWYVPDYVLALDPALTAAGAIAASPVFAVDDGGSKPRFISCPPDWGCALINRNLLAAHGLADFFDVVEPANRFEMDALIGESVSRQQPFVAYYWQPNALLSQFAFTALDMSEYNEEAAKCLARASCVNPSASGFPPETVVNTLAEWVFLDSPEVAAYFQRAIMPMAVMNDLLAQLDAAGGAPEAVAQRFIAERGDIWAGWVGPAE